MNKTKPEAQNDDIWSLGNYVVSVMDVLGQKEAIRSLPAILSSEMTLDSLDAALRASIGKRDYFSRQVAVALSEAFAIPTDEIFQTLPNEHKEVIESVRNHFKFKTYGFSDTLVHYSHIAHEHARPSMLSIVTLIHAISVTMLVCLAKRTPIRGGIEGGFAMISPTDEIYGPAFLSAYEIESSESEYPRVVVGKNLQEMVKIFTRDSDPFTQSLHDRYMDMVIEDRDGKKIIDLRSEMLTSNMKNYSEYMKEAIEFACNEANRFRGCSNAKLALRYERLVDCLTMLNK